MRYVSTRGGIEAVGFAEAVRMGLADDGGLLIPASIPALSVTDGSYVELACQVMQPLAGSFDLGPLVQATYDWPVAPLVPVGDRYVLELFHGPTLAFKDVALQLLGRLFTEVLAGEPMNILAATSGDTGSAAIYGVRGRRGIRIFVMHPRGRVAPLQELQMTTVLDANVHNLAVRGTFDDCQRILKTVLGDLEFKRRYHLGAVNSVNWARVLAQIVYYFAAWTALGKPGQISFAVPTGNFGDVLAGWYASRMGLPVTRLAVATNSNDILARFFATGDYVAGSVEATLAPAMDIQVASNFERYLYYRLGEDPAAVRDAMAGFASSGRLHVSGEDPLWVAGRATREDILKTIRAVWEACGYVMDPHTAVGWHVASQLELPGPVVCLATAHPAKFPEAIVEAGLPLPRHPQLDALEGMPTRCQEVESDPEAIRALIASVASADTAGDRR